MRIFSKMTASCCVLIAKACTRSVIGLFLLAWFFHPTLTFMPYSLFIIASLLGLALLSALGHTYYTSTDARVRTMCFYATIYLIPAGFFLYWGLFPSTAWLMQIFPYVIGGLLLIHGLTHTLLFVLQKSDVCTENILSVIFITVTSILSIPLFFMEIKSVAVTLIAMLLLASLFSFCQCAAYLARRNHQAYHDGLGGEDDRGDQQHDKEHNKPNITRVSSSPSHDRRSITQQEENASSSSSLGNIRN